jgi:hypothetical protein
VTHYDVLGVGRNASPADVRRAYLDLARLHHPDVHVDADAGVREAARQRMALVNEAWRVLGDDARRRAYDTELGGRLPPHGDDADDAEDEVDAEELFDEWLEQHPPPKRRSAGLLTMAPVLLVLAAVGLGSFGLTTGFVALLALAAGCLALAAVLFVLAPLVAMTSARRHERTADWSPRRH